MLIIIIIVVVLICQMEEDKERVEYALAQMEDLAHSSVHAINQFIEVSTDNRLLSLSFAVLFIQLLSFKLLSFNIALSSTRKVFPK